MDFSEWTNERLIDAYKRMKPALPGLYREIWSRIEELNASELCALMTSHVGQDDRQDHVISRRHATGEALKRIQDGAGGISVFYACSLDRGLQKLLTATQQSILEHLENLPSSDIINAMYIALRHGHRTMASRTQGELQRRGFSLG